MEVPAYIRKSIKALAIYDREFLKLSMGHNTARNMAYDDYSDYSDYSDSWAIEDYVDRY